MRAGQRGEREPERRVRVVAVLQRRRRARRSRRRARPPPRAAAAAARTASARRAAPGGRSPARSRPARGAGASGGTLAVAERLEQRAHVLELARRAASARARPSSSCRHRHGLRRVERRRLRRAVDEQALDAVDRQPHPLRARRHVAELERQRRRRRRVRLDRARCSPPSVSCASCAGRSCGFTSSVTVTRRVVASRVTVVGGSCGSGASSIAATFDSRGSVSPGRISETLHRVHAGGPVLLGRRARRQRTSMPVGSVLAPIVDLVRVVEQAVREARRRQTCRRGGAPRAARSRRAAPRAARRAGSTLRIVGYGGSRLGSTTTPRSRPVASRPARARARAAASATACAPRSARPTRRTARVGR